MVFVPPSSRKLLLPCSQLLQTKEPPAPTKRAGSSDRHQMATQSTRSRSHSRSSKERVTSSSTTPQLNKRNGKKPVCNNAARDFKRGKKPSPPAANAADEEEYEVESIQAHKWSEEYQEYEYLLKWKGYGEEENSWVPASGMNCWELLQAYLSKNIFNSPATVSLSCPVPLSNSASLKGKVHSGSGSSKFKSRSKSKLARSREFDDQSSPRDILVSNTLHSTTSKGTLRLHLSEPTSTGRTASSLHRHRRTTERDRFKKSAHFFTPKHLPSSLKFRELKPVSSRSRPKMKCVPKQASASKKNDVHHPILSSPSMSPLLSSCDDSSPMQSDGSVSIDESFQLHLDSDEDSSTHSLPGENPLLATKQPRTNLHSPRIQFNGCSPKRKRRINGINHSLLLHKNKVKSTLKSLPNGHSTSSQMVGLKTNGIMHRIPTLTTLSTTGSSSDSESWSKRRLRKRGHSSSPSPHLEFSSHVSSTNGGCHAEVSSTASSLIAKAFPARFPLPLTSTLPPPISLSSQSGGSSDLVVAQYQSPSAEYQQELLEWQFLLNKQCRPTEAYILVENHMDEAPIPQGFKYITSNMYGEGVPDPTSPEVASLVCGCTCYLIGKKCGLKNQHCCPKMAGAEFPYSLAGKIRIPPGNPIYECNSRCSCPPDCINRVVQRGRKINMCIFRTPNGRGWGVKTMEPIKPNTFVTEYVGEVVTTEEAERRGELYDQEGRTYLFDLDFNCDDNAFTIDAANYGNISHFFNHSCNPNLRVYSVWIDTLDERLPRIAFFSTQSISTGQELTFDYQMNQEEQGQVECLCGEANCCGYLY